MHHDGFCGLVLSKFIYEYPYVMRAVFVDNNSRVLFIRSREFSTLRFKSKAERKQYEKIDRERKVVAGDWIQFNALSDSGYIDEYEKAFRLCESRITAGCLQVESICVFSAWTKGVSIVCWNELFGWVSVQNETAERFLPNVAYKCWLNVHVDDGLQINVTFAEFIDVPDDQSPVAAAPWNKGDPRFAVRVGNNSELMTSFATNMVKSRGFDLPNQLYDACGLLVGDRQVYCARFAHISIQLAYVANSKSEASVGDRIKFDAAYSLFLNHYVVYKYGKLRSTSSIGYKYSSSGFRALLDVEVKWMNLPFGYVWTRSKQLGVVHDRDGILSSLLLTPLRNSVFRVYVSDMGPNAFSRFRLEEIISVRNARKQDMGLLDREHILLEGVGGIVIGSNNVFSPQYGTLKIRFGKCSSVGWETLEPGSWIDFTMQSDPRPPSFTVCKWERIPVSPLKFKFDKEHYQFCITARFNSYLSVLESDLFGFIDDPDQQLSVTCESAHSEMISVWVKTGDSRSRTPFVFVSLNESFAMPSRINSANYTQAKVCESIRTSLSGSSYSSISSGKSTRCGGVNCDAHRQS